MNNDNARMIDVFHSMTEAQKNFIYTVIDIALLCTSKKEFRSRIKIETTDAYQSMTDSQKLFTEILIESAFTN